jgi:hypothetical protein
MIKAALELVTNGVNKDEHHDQASSDIKIIKIIFYVSAILQGTTAQHDCLLMQFYLNYFSA